uniref:Uncharacterized protein n=1 Tax=Cacopsylla melanoneura TaxID=428564 RepID=A0A8D8RDP0_9HEMI
MAPKKKMTREEILLKKRLCERERYQRMKQDPQLRAEMKEKEKMRYAQKKEKKQVKSTKDMTASELRQKRKQWRVHSNAYRRRTNPTRCTSNTPPESPLGGDHQQDNGQRNSARKRDQSKIIQKLKQVNENLKRNADKWKHHYYRLRKEYTAVVNTPRTHANKIVKTTDEIYCPETIDTNITSRPIYGIKEEYSIDLPIEEENSTDLPMKEEYSTDLPIEEEYSTDLPIKEEYSTDLSIGDR